jgi:tetratricopeptide (TPR) repeat protein
MTRSTHRALAWIVNLLVPGTGWVLAGRMVSGIAVSLLWGLAATGVLARLIWPDIMSPPLWSAFIAATTVLYLTSQTNLYRIIRAADRRLSSEARDEKFKAAVIAYMAGRHDEAEAACRALLREDPDDVEAMLQLGSLARRRGRLAEARRCFQRARYLDDRGRWDAEIGRELASIEVAAGRGAAMRPSDRGR